jgi:signal transduction histidine kinase
MEQEHVAPVKVHRTVTVQAMVLGAILIAGLWALPLWLWQGPQSIHIALEFISALLALIVALGGIIRYIALGQRLVLLFGLSFLGAGLADLVNAAVSLDVLASGQGEDPTTWTAGRLTHSVLLLASLTAGQWMPQARRITLELGGALFLTVILGAVTIMVLSRHASAIMGSEYALFRQMAEWGIVLLFFWSAWGYLQLHVSQRIAFYDWAAAAAVILGVAQVYAALFVNWRESSVNIPHALKVFGYIAALTGLYMDNLALFKETQRQRDTLDVQNRHLERTNKDLAALLSISREIAEMRETERLVQFILNRSVALIPQMETGLLFLYDAVQERLVPRAVLGVPFPLLNGLRIRPDESCWGQVFTTGQPRVSYVSDDAAAALDGLDAENKRMLKTAFRDRPPVQQSVCAPLIEHGETIGIMVLNNHAIQHPFTDRQITFFQTLCNQVGGAIRNAQLYAQIQQYARQVQAKNQELESFVYTASHDLRSPLVSLHGLLAMFSKSMGDRLDERGLRYVTRLEANVSQMEELIDGLLELSRVGRADARIEPLDTNRMVQDLAEQLRPQLEKQEIHLVVRPLPSVAAPAIQMKQVFSNLMSNAVKYMGDSLVRRVEVGGGQDENSVYFYVQDTGIGIDPAYHDKIFAIFQRLKDLEDVKGTGVGLAIVKKIIDNLGGVITVDSAKGKGAKFTFTLPILQVVQGDMHRS